MPTLDPAEAAAYLRCTYRQIFKLKKRGELEGTYFYVGTRVFFNSEKLAEWTERGGSRQFKN
jgi:hypothetical protein